MFRKVLVANRGEIALRVMRTCGEMGIRSVAVYSDADRNAPHVREAEEAIRIGPAAPSESYLCVASIIDAAHQASADAIHPGYGFLSENPALPEACATAGITFVGPPAEVMRLMGDKPAARSLAADRGVPVLPGFAGDSQKDRALLARAGEIGFPIMVKAAAGGGGRGMRLVPSADMLPEALAGARREASGAFGDDRLLLEHAVVGGRHVEVQVLADASGSVIHLGERDCSIQRRHQKVIEETPAPSITPSLRERITAAALDVTRAAGYVNAGTVEFLVDREGGFYFLEMNTRLQVEHGVTELVTGLDLVELQLRVAAGEPLPTAQDDVRSSGHAIECRIYAEDPGRGFLPSSGRVTYFLPPEGESVRNDTGIVAGIDVPTEYDSLLAKLLVHAPSREEALERCGRALDAYAVDGVRTNLGLLRTVLGSQAFGNGEADLATLEGMATGEFEPRLPDEVLLAAAGIDAGWLTERRSGDPWEALGAWRVGGRSPMDHVYHGCTFAFETERVIGEGNALRANIAGRAHEFTVSSGGPSDLVVLEAGAERRWTVQRDGSHLILESDGHRYVLGRPDRSASAVSHGVSAGSGGALRAPMPGVIVRILVAEGERVAARQPLVLLEAMKMEHIIESNMDGLVANVACKVGQKVGDGDVLIELEGEDDGAS